ncbi:hypothetical protein AKJ18_16815 [Vibrio xuii]|nr:hypothetical protein AKJ18_16815 [Vibrio xuii]
MKIIKLTLLFLSICLSQSALALTSGECTFSNTKLTYSGMNIPSSSETYKDGEVLGQLILTTSYSCLTYSLANNDVVLQIGTRGAGNSFINNERYRSNVSGIILEAKHKVRTVATYNNEIIFVQFRKPTYSNDQRISGTFNQPVFDVIKSGEIKDASSVTLNLEKSFKLLSFLYSSGTDQGVYIDPTNVPDTAAIPVYNASCSITHPTNVEVPALIPGVRSEVSSYFNVVLNCADKVVMQNNVQLTVNPIFTTGISLSVDKTSLLYNHDGLLILMNIFNSVGTETQMSFETMYQFNNSSKGNSFTIPMRAKFLLGSTQSGDYSFQTQLSVRYN